MPRAYSRRTYLGVVGATGLAGIAGCTGDETDDAGTPTGPLAPPAGTSDDGIEDVTTLTDATREALVANDYALESVVPIAESSSITARIRSSRDDERQLFVFDAPSETNRMYVADGTRYVKSTSTNETTYETMQVESFTTVHEENDQVQLLDGSEGLGGILRNGTYAPDETVTRNGRRLLRFNLTSATFGDDVTVTSSDGELFISADSIVFEAHLSATIEDNGTTNDISPSFIIDELGDVTVSEPDWVETAREQN